MLRKGGCLPHPKVAEHVSACWQYSSETNYIVSSPSTWTLQSRAFRYGVYRTRVWTYLHGTWASGTIKANWYTVIHDIPSTNERLHLIHLTVSALCTACGERDTSMHRLTECGEGARIWDWTGKRIAWILRTDPARIPQEWTLRPQFHIWPLIRHRAVPWILAHMVWFRIRESRTVSAQEYSDFLCRVRWKGHQATGRVNKVGNYLGIL